MSGHLIDLPDPNGVAANGTATADIPRIGAYRKLNILYEPGGTPANLATMTSDIEEIRLRINGVDQWVVSADELIKLNSIYGKTYVDGRLPCFFAEPHRRTVMGEDATIWGMGDVSSFQLSVKIASGAVSPQLRLSALREPGARPMGEIRKLKRFNLPVSNTGMNWFEPPTNDDYRAIHMQTSNISNVRVLVDDKQKINETVAALNDQMDDQNLVPVSGWSSIMFDDDRRVASMLFMRPDGAPAVQDLRVGVNMTAATGFDYLTETVGLRDA
ncbi:major capsid protein P2 [Pyruvatibacter mobilis]|uniref:major capsid protein P2 n=1 Tax=Pyruvatibacter mobilis TaxID=1712261 RepID=UPI003BA95C15